MKADEILQKLFFSPVSKEELIDQIGSIIKEQVENANEKILIKLAEEYPYDEILTLEELCQRFKREAPTVKKAIVSLGIVPHSYDEKANPLYLYSEVIAAIKKSPSPK